VSEASSSKRGLPLRVKMRHSAHFVDDLAIRHESPIGRMLPLSSIRPNPSQPRADVGDLTDLVASIREKGVLEPILVRPVSGEEPAGRERPDAAAEFVIIAGERRFRAALEAGLFEVPVIELAVSEEEALEITLIENLQRKDLDPFEEAEGYRALAERHRYTHEQIAKAVGKSRSTVTESVALLEIPEQVRRAATQAGVRAKSALLEIARAESPARMLAMVDRAARLGLTRDDLRSRGKESGRAAGRGKGAPRKSPYVFKFRAPDRKFSVQLSFRQSTVEKGDLIRAIEQVLKELRESPD
jgi:ParB family transcriptional regulator, chromosome partitioning protein